jgi:hypothetical protein
LAQQIWYPNTAGPQIVARKILEMNCGQSTYIDMPGSAQLKQGENTMKTIRQWVAVVLVGALPGLCSPVLAGDFIARTISIPPAGLGVTLGLGSGSPEAGLPSGNAAFSFQAPDQQQPPQPASPPPPAQQRSLTTKGKVLKWVGVGLMGSGGLTAGLGAAEFSSSNCSPYSPISCSTARNVYLATGGAIAGVGALLFFIGIHNRE